MKKLTARAAGMALLSFGFVFLACAIPFLAPRDAPVSAEPLYEITLPLVMIDPGHGGRDAGALGADGTKEKDINLRLSAILYEEFVEAGYPCRLTRTEDIQPTDGEEHATKKESDLHARVLAAADAGIFLSVHCNAFPSEQYSGAQIYYGVADGSSLLADRIRDEVRLLVPENHRETKDGSAFYLLSRVTCPCVLIESGFLSNTAERERLKDDAYLHELARALFLGVDAFVAETAT